MKLITEPKYSQCKINSCLKLPRGSTEKAPSIKMFLFELTGMHSFISSTVLSEQKRNMQSLFLGSIVYFHLIWNNRIYHKLLRLGKLPALLPVFWENF